MTTNYDMIFNSKRVKKAKEKLVEVFNQAQYLEADDLRIIAEAETDFQDVVNTECRRRNLDPFYSF